MLEVEVHIEGGLAPELSAVVSALWNNTEVEIDDDTLRFRPEESTPMEHRLRVLELTLHALEKAGAKLPLTVRTWDLDDPADTPQTVRVGDFLICRPDLDIHTEPYQHTLYLEPAGAFGTGKHPTTALCLAALQEFASKVEIKPKGDEYRILDAGTGSGVLSLAAAEMTGHKVLAVDCSSQAVEAARRNARRNRRDNLIHTEQKRLKEIDGCFDLITANLVVPAILEEGHCLADLLTPNGLCILSGFSNYEKPRIMRKLAMSRVEVMKSYSHAYWSAVVFKLPD